PISVIGSRITDISRTVRQTCWRCGDGGSSPPPVCSPCSSPFACSRRANHLLALFPMSAESSRSQVARLLRRVGLTRLSELERQRAARERTEQQLVETREHLRHARERSTTLHAQLRAQHEKLKEVEARYVRVRTGLTESREQNRHLDALYGGAGARL